MRFFKDDEVVLAANEDEGWERQLATIKALHENGTITVELLAPEDEDDDGLRDVTPEQVEFVLDRIEYDALGCIAEARRPVDAAELSRLLPITTSRARSTLGRLERKSLVEATYTDSPGRGRAYKATIR